MTTATATDADLEALPDDKLLDEITEISRKLDEADRLRTRRTRAFRVLRARQVPRARIAEAAGITPGGVGNLINALAEREAADEQRRHQV